MPSPVGTLPGARPYFDSRQAAADKMIENLAYLMDRSIPLGRGYSIGLDPIIGLIPGIGDLIGTVVSGVIIYQAQRAGVSKSTVMRMMINVAIDSAVGTIPFMGDVFDFAFKANQKNLQLYRESMWGTRDVRRDTWFVAVVFIGLAILLALPVLAIVWLVRAIF